MKISRIALFAGLGMLAMAVPAAAAPAPSGGTDVRTAKPDLMQLAQQNRTRQINEERGGLFKKKAKPKKKKKGKRK